MARTGSLSERGSVLRLLNDGLCAPADTMARDRALLEAFQKGLIPPTLRLYRWASPAITYGLNQRVPETLSAEAQRLGLPLLRRPTGGKAVLHGHDLTLALIWRPALERPYPLTVYRTVMPAFVSAFRRLGIPAQAGEEKPHPPCETQQDGGDCFARTTPADVVHSETRAKLMGCALRVLPEATLLQASIPLTTPTVPVERLFGHSHPTPPPLDAEQLCHQLYETLTQLLESRV